MNEIDKWAAEQCRVTFFTFDVVGPYDPTSRIIPQPSHEQGFIYQGERYYFDWTLDDARCREIAREHLKIITTLFRTASGDEWMAMSDITLNGRKNKTIAEAEIACIEAIFNESVK